MYVRVRVSVWLVSGYAHVFIILSVVIVTFPKRTRYDTIICMHQ